MRTIKFRAWHKIMNKMLTEDEWHHYGPIIHKGEVNSLDHEIMQFTGITDLNGVDIYDGDILKDHGIVAWNDKEYRWAAIDLNWNDRREWHDIDYLTSPFEIIGNIHENPELI